MRDLEALLSDIEVTYSTALDDARDGFEAKQEVNALTSRFAALENRL